MSEDDPTINVSIRTGTSTRRPVSRPTDSSRHEWVPQQRRRVEQNTVPVEISIDFIPLNTPMTTLNSADMNYANLLALMRLSNRGVDIRDILQRSMQDGELKRDSSVQLDIEKKEYKQGDSSHDCPICQVAFNVGDKISTIDRCKHTFHHSCLDEWGKYKQSCPLCRTPIPVLEG